MFRSVVLLTCGIAGVLSGCDSASFVPPPPPELRTPDYAALESTAKVIELVMPRDDTPERKVWAAVLRLEAGIAKAGFRSSALQPDDPPAREAELIRAAASRGATVLIVEPTDAPAVAEALAQVQSQGTSVLLLGRPLTVSGKVLPMVAPEPSAGSARKMVDAAVAAAKAAKCPDDGKALIVVPKPADMDTADERDALQTALKAAGVEHVETVEFDGTGDGAFKAISERLKADPKISIILTTSGDAYAAAGNAKDALKATRPVIVAGFTEIDINVSAATLERGAAVVDRNVIKTVRKAFQLALALSRGETVPERTEIPPTVREFASTDAAAPAEKPAETKSATPASETK